MAATLPDEHTALVQTTYAQPLELKSLPTPKPTPGSAVVKILFAPVVSYAKEVFNGTRKTPYPTPLVPGPSAVGRVAALGPDSTLFNIGDLVFVDCVVRSRDDPTDMFLLGFMQGGTAGSAKLMKDVWRNGTFAEYARVPLENVYALNERRLVQDLGYKQQELAMLSKYLVPYGGLRNIDVRAGETVVITPATGGFGGAAVAVALAMGANVIATGRNQDALKSLVNTFGEAIKTVVITNDAETDTSALQEAAGGPVDVVFEISPQMAAKSTHIKSAILALRHGGRVSLMGGIRDDYPIPFSAVVHKDLVLKGKWMYDRSDVQSLTRMVETGRLKIGERNGVKIVGDYTFAEWEKAFDRASEQAHWDAQVVMRPGN